MKKLLLPLVIAAALSGCATSSAIREKVVGRQFDEPEVAKVSSYLTNQKINPPSDGPIPVAVYSFTDKTGQRKQSQTIASFSSAVTQGADAYLIKALQEAGDGHWFRVVERVGLDNLLKERQLIRSARDEAKDPTSLRPIIYAGMILEGSIVSYDTNIRSGGFGWRWLGIGPSTNYTEDVVTISLRVVSTQTGEVLLTTNVQKTVLSYQVGVATFKAFEDGTRIFENEIGMTSTEIGIYVLKSAVEKGVENIIFDGEKYGLWKFKEKEIKNEN